MDGAEDKTLVAAAEVMKILKECSPVAVQLIQEVEEELCEASSDEDFIFYCKNFVKENLEEYDDYWGGPGSLPGLNI